MSVTIKDKDEFRQALDSYWVASSLIKDAKDECKQEKKKMMLRITLMLQEVNNLRPAIQKYMIDNNLTTVKSKGKTFSLKWRKAKSKLSNDEIAEMMRDESVDEEIVTSFLKIAEKKKEKTSGTIECKILEEEEI